MWEIFMTKSAILASVIGAASLLLTATGILSYPTPIVTLEDGQLEGRVAFSRNGTEYLEFLGIPYAQPPIGDLRFEAPVPVKPWKNEVKQATKYPPFCVQFDALVRGKVYGVEDCLYLNVFTHSVEPEKKKPVMVYIHGGGFFSGATQMYGGKYLMDEDIVLVTMNYRLGAFGFLNTGDELVRGNMGLKDQNLALRWVHKNINKFGGDPTRVTLFGESAGAASVMYHILKGEGLFQRALAQSGAVTCPWAFMRRPKEIAAYYGQLLSCPTENSSVLVNCLRNMDAAEIVKPTMLYMTPTRDFEMFLPSIETVQREDTFLSEDPVKLLESGKYPKVPLIMGVTSGEGGLRTARLDAMPEFIPEIDKNWHLYSPRFLMYTGAPQESEATGKIRSFYFGTKPFTENLHEFFANFTKLNSDGFFYEPIHRAAVTYAKDGPPTYLYYYDYNSVLLPSFYSIFRAIRPDDWILADVKMHATVIWDMLKEHVFESDGPHQFGITHAEDLFQMWQMEWILERLSTPDLEFSQKFIKTFVNFAKNEEPLQFDGVSWPPIKPKDGSPLQYMELNNQGKVIPEPFADRVKFWESLRLWKEK